MVPLQRGEPGIGADMSRREQLAAPERGADGAHQGEVVVRLEEIQGHSLVERPEEFPGVWPLQLKLFVPPGPPGGDGLVVAKQAGKQDIQVGPRVVQAQRSAGEVARDGDPGVPIRDHRVAVGQEDQLVHGNADLLGRLAVGQPGSLIQNLF